VTIRLSGQVLRKAKILAAQRETSISGLRALESSRLYLGVKLTGARNGRH